MDWLRSEDLKEEKVVTASSWSVSRAEWICSFQIEPALVSMCLLVANAKLIFKKYRQEPELTVFTAL
jgi:hypothetical protein